MCTQTNMHAHPLTHPRTHVPTQNPRAYAHAHAHTHTHRYVASGKKRIDYPEDSINYSLESESVPPRVGREGRRAGGGVSGYGAGEGVGRWATRSELEEISDAAAMRLEGVARRGIGCVCVCVCVFVCCVRATLTHSLTHSRPHSLSLSLSLALSLSLSLSLTQMDQQRLHRRHATSATDPRCIRLSTRGQRLL